MADHNQFDVDAILDELQEKGKQQAEEVVVPKKPVFELNLDLDSEYGEAVETSPVVREETVVVSNDPITAPSTATTVNKTASEPKPQKAEVPGLGCLKALIYSLAVVLISVVLSYLIVVGGLDYTGLNRPESMVDISVPEGASTKVIAQMLEENGLIEQTFIFRMYAKFTGADGKWQPGDFSVAPNMGYKLLIESLQAAKARETVSVLIPEGFTIDKIAKRLEEKKVCTASEFYLALTEVDYSKDYDFIRDSQNATDYASRIYKMEGYLFPDTYQFYEGCSGETVVRKMLNNFEYRMDTTIRSAMSARNINMDELIILASIVQGEAASKSDMEKVARVLDNRLNDPVNFPKLQCDSTRDYIKKLMGNTSLNISNAMYDTYEKNGLPAGPINNPGLDAIKAVLMPSEDAAVQKCYFFATDYDTGITYFSKTYEQHVSICKRYGIGMYG